VAASTQEEKDKWLEDIVQAVQYAKEAPEDSTRINYYSLKSCSSSEEVLDKTGTSADDSGSKERTQQQRSNTTVHVCWHRNTSISSRDHLLALEVFLFLFCFFYRLLKHSILLFIFGTESIERLFTKEVQKQQWMAETVGGIHQLLPVLLQNVSS